MEATGSSHCGAGLRAASWAGQGAGLGSPTSPELPPSFPSRSCSRRSRSTSFGFRLHPVGMIREPWSTLQGRGAPGSGTPSGSEQGEAGWGRGVVLETSGPTASPQSRQPERPGDAPDHTTQRKHKATQLPGRKLDLGAEEVALSWSGGAWSHSWED